jgi:type I restriction enzyme S subunit
MVERAVNTDSKLSVKEKMATSQAAGWSNKRFGNLAVFRNGLNFVKSDNGARAKVIGVSDFQQHFRISYDQLDTVRVAGALVPDNFLHNNDLLFVRSNGNKALIGRCILLENLTEPVCFSGFTIRARITDSQVLPLFAGIYFQSEKARSAIHQAGEGSHISNLSQEVLASIEIPIPPLPEQRAIAEALSDVDGLLGGLERLVAKKRDLKQAAMQQLLTGQTRLPGFHGEWEVKRLKEIAEISSGINKPLSEMGSGALYVTVQDLYDGTSIRTGRLSRIKVSPNEIETKGLTVGDIVFGKSSVKRDGIGYPSQFLGCGEPVVFSGFTYRARARQGIADAAFLFYALRAEKTRRWLIDNSQSSALTNINQTIADAIPVKTAPSVPEQTAIAEVLTEMDVELATLEQRREKSRALKQAMMQELLTGRTRLVSPDSIHA